MKKIIPRESATQSVICEYLALKKYFFWRNNNFPPFDATRKVFRAMPKFALRGVPDVIVVRVGGNVCFLEIKREGAKLSVWQQEFKKRCEEVKAEYYVVYSLDDVIAIGL